MLYSRYLVGNTWSASGHVLEVVPWCKVAACADTADDIEIICILESLHVYLHFLHMKMLPASSQVCKRDQTIEGPAIPIDSDRCSKGVLGHFKKSTILKAAA